MDDGGNMSLPSKESIERQFVDSGEKDRLKEILIRKLDECGWNAQVQARCRELIKEKGIESVSANELVNEVTPFARKQVPGSVKVELLELIRQHLQQTSTLNDL